MASTRAENAATQSEKEIELSNTGKGAGANTGEGAVGGDLRESGAVLMPKFDDRGLLGAIVQDAQSMEVLMFAFMNAEALAKTQETGLAHFYSRSRDQLWQKGETSGNVLRVENMRVDCDQDAIVLKVHPAGPACHTGKRSCFYRALDKGQLSPLD